MVEAAIAGLAGGRSVAVLGTTISPACSGETARDLGLVREEWGSDIVRLAEEIHRADAGARVWNAGGWPGGTVVSTRGLEAVETRWREETSRSAQESQAAFRAVMGDVDALLKLSRPSVEGERALVFFEEFAPSGSSCGGYIACEDEGDGWRMVEQFVLMWGCR